MAIKVTVYADDRRWAALVDDHGRTERFSGIRVSRKQDNRIHAALAAMKNLGSASILLQSNSKGMYCMLRRVHAWKEKTGYFKDASALADPFLKFCALHNVSYKRIAPLEARRIVSWELNESSLED
jgi:hypothetical protein